MVRGEISIYYHHHTIRDLKLLTCFSFQLIYCLIVDTLKMLEKWNLNMSAVRLPCYTMHNAVLQNAVWGENGSDTVLLLPPLRSAVRRENNVPQLNAGPGYSETWISWSCQLCFQFRIKQDLKIYICTKVPSSILQISITGYRSSLPHSIKTFVEIIIFYWAEWNLLKMTRIKLFSVQFLLTAWQQWVCTNCVLDSKYWW